MMQKKIKIILFGFICISILVLILYQILTPLSVETITLEKTQANLTFTEDGDVKNSSAYVIYPTISGQLDRLYVHPGDQVKAGDLLFSLNDSLISASVKAASSAIDALESQKNTAINEASTNSNNLALNRSQINQQLNSIQLEKESIYTTTVQALLVKQNQRLYQQGLDDLDDYKTLLDEGIISESDYRDFLSVVEQYEYNYAQSLSTKSWDSDYVTSMKENMSKQISLLDKSLSLDFVTDISNYYDALISQSNATLESLEQEQSLYHVVAPCDGIINDVFIGQDNIVSVDQEALMLIGKGTYQVETYIDTRDCSSIALGDKVTLSLDQRGDDLITQGTISHIADTAITQTSTLGLDEQKVQVLIDTTENSFLKNGYGVDVTFSIYSEDDQLVVPNSALYQVDGQDMLMCIVNGQATEKNVTTGYELTGSTIILSGVNEGDIVITDLDTDGLKAGVKVTPAQ